MVGTTNPVTWFEVHTPDPARTRRFYEAMFGWSFAADMAGYDLIGMGEDAPIGGGIASTGPDHLPMNVFCVQVTDVEDVCRRVGEAGGSVVRDRQTSDAGLAFAYLSDPNGSVFGVWTPPTGG